MAGRIPRTASDFARDLRNTARLLAREPGYTVALLGIALGIGATTTLFSVAYGVLLKPLPWPEPDRLVRLEERRGGRPGRIPWTITNGTYLAWTEAATVEEVGGWMSVTSTFSDRGEPERIRLGRLTPTIFTVLRADALIGRVFEPADAGPRADTVILSHGFWQRRFGGAPNVLGRSVRLDERVHTVIGVMPAAFGFPDRETQAWTPAYIAPVFSEGGDRISLQIVGVVEDMKQGGLQTGSFVATTDAAQPEMFSSYRQFGEMRLDNVFFLARAESDPSRLVPSMRSLVRDQAPALVLDSVMTMEARVMASLSRPRAYALVVGVMAAFALAIACVGLFGVLSYSVAQRAREIGVRTALGARTGDIVSLVLRSGLTLVFAGLAGGLAAAALLVQSLSKILYGVRPFDPVTFAIVPLFLVLAAAVACVAPARRAARIDPLRALRGD